jgi:SAM-dependent methyltransferase
LEFFSTINLFAINISCLNMNVAYQIILGIIIIILAFYLFSSSTEYFENAKDRQTDTYDELDAKLYDEVFDFKDLYKEDAEGIHNFLQSRLSVEELDKKAKILDCGTGCGKHYQYLSNWFQVIGLDKSINLLDIARTRNPLGEFKKGLMEDTKLFSPNEFVGVTCLVETIHMNTLDKMEIILKNIHLWLRSGGYLFIHLFDSDNLDPGPREFSQYYQDGDIKHALTYFDEFSLDSWWSKKSEGNYQYNQKFILDNGKSRLKIVNMYIPPLKIMIQKILDIGFKLIAVKDLEKAHISAFRMYVFQKI